MKEKAQDSKSGIAGVKNLDAGQAGNVSKALELLTRAESLFGTKDLDALPPKLDEVLSLAKDAGKFRFSNDQIEVMDRKHKLRKAADAAGEAGQIVGKLGKLFDVSAIAKSVDKMIEALDGAANDKVDPGDALDVTKKSVRDAKQQLNELRERFEKTPKALKNIIFVLKSFLALNAPGKTDAPKPAEVAAFRAATGMLSEDINTVFGGGKEVVSGFDVFLLYADGPAPPTRRAGADEGGRGRGGVADSDAGKCRSGTSSH